MRKSLIALLFAVLSIVPLSASEWGATIKQVEKSIVYININDEGGCTGFVIDAERKYVMTAAHCDGAKLYVDNVLGEVVAKDGKKDLMVLYVKHLDPTKTALKLGAEPKIGDEVISAGFGYALERPFYRKAMVSDNAVMIPEGGVGGPFVGVDSGFIGGQSGGPVVNINGEVVSIVQMASDKLGIGVGADIIRERVGRFWAQK